MKSTPLLEEQLNSLFLQGHLKMRSENNAYLKISYQGSGGFITPKWNIKIYTSGSVVCTDFIVLQGAISGKLKAPDESLKLIQIDDAGVGFPLLGAMVGVTDGNQVWTDMVPVKFFQEPLYDTKAYLEDFAQRGLSILEDIGTKPKTHRIEICTGYINKNLKGSLRDLGYDVRIVEIKGLLQDQLEERFRYNVKGILGVDLAYDVKFLKKKEIPNAYYKALGWGRHYAPHLLKTGWKSMQVKG